TYQRLNSFLHPYILFTGYGVHRDLHSFPTRRSSDLRHLERVLEQVAEEPEGRIGELQLLDEEEWQQVVVEWNRTEEAYPRERCLHELFGDQARRQPEAVALVYEDGQMSYGELNRRANQVGRYRRRMGVGPELRVGSCLSRSPER